MKQRLPEAKFNERESYGKACVFTLPFSCVDRFGAFFDELDQGLAGLGLTEYGVSITSMEDVFLKVGQEGRKEEKGRRSSDDGTKKHMVQFGGSDLKRATFWDQASKKNHSKDVEDLLFLNTNISKNCIFELLLNSKL